MELYIRSQDRKKLLKIDNIGIVDYNGCYYVVGYKNDEEIKLGEYGYTATRALEILDEIQNILKPKYILDSKSIKPNGNSYVENGVVMQNYSANARIEELSTYVYEMPKE